MELDLTNIFKAQYELDHRIHLEHNVNYEIIKPELKLALYTELAECANEVKCFKFWSYQEASKKETILEEYVDGIHFITSLCISYETDQKFDIKHQLPFQEIREITDAFNELFASIDGIKNKKTAYKWYQQYLEFGLKLGYSLQDILDAYVAKCKINHKRQDNKY